MEKTRFIELLQKYLADQTSAEEAEQLLSSLADHEGTPAWEEAITSVLRDKRFHGLSDPRVMNEVRKAILTEQGGTSVHRIPFFRTGWFRYAASVIVMIGIGVTIWITQGPPGQPPLTARQSSPQDVPPGGYKAVLTLGGGQKIILDSAVSGLLATQGEIRIIKTGNDQLSYQGTDKTTRFNTLSTPRGGQYRLKLPDGSDVWLNSASSITYPTVFTGEERSVEISGEVYFEVTKNKTSPFHVKVNDLEVEVLGTQFNINAYGDEASIRTTLLEGSVKVNKGTGTGLLLKPGEQAVATLAQEKSPASGDHQIRMADHVNVDQVMAWKNGLFNFNGLSLPAVMRQLERWYDIKVSYAGPVPDVVFKGKMYRDLGLRDVLEILPEMGVHFRMNGRNLLVL